MNKSEIKQLQRALRETVAPKMVVDGDFGKQTVEAIAVFAKMHGTDAESAKALLYRYADIRYVSDDAFVSAAQILGVKESFVRAIAEVETNGESFLKDGRIKVLFERHWFRRKLGEALQKPEVRKNVAAELDVPVPTDAKAAATLLALVEKKFNGICSAERGGYKGGEAEWDRLNQAMDFDIEAAAMSASYGGYQLMGFNYQACGYKSAKSMMLDLAASESKQFLAMVSFIKANPGMHAALKKGDWAKFAEAYNGPAYRENKYDVKLASSEKKWSTTAVA